MYYTTAKPLNNQDYLAHQLQFSPYSMSTAPHSAFYAFSTFFIVASFPLHYYSMPSGTLTPITKLQSLPLPLLPPPPPTITNHHQPSSPILTKPKSKTQPSFSPPLPTLIPHPSSPISHPLPPSLLPSHPVRNPLPIQHPSHTPSSQSSQCPALLATQSQSRPPTQQKREKSYHSIP